ncbi:hypothetical protein [Variovorax sp. RA8]|uniref:hypothetical protein n=1 Tax=Variovorax sp. (strain JCM 16519 / RA8) TaxID=662548 RepID=UPI000A3DDA4E|nr:hypothetical protein [Variovorax sp. RA8]VTU34154.1 hypothetical protein RA8CHR_04916 [Variovorax sp. RA8]
MTGQANSAPVSEDDLAAFLVDNPEADTLQDAPNNGDEPGPDPDNSDADENPGGDAEDDSPDEDDAGDGASDPAKGQPSGQKFKVSVKGEDGADTELEVDEKELVASYMRHSDYTRKTMELGERERQAHSLVEQRLTQGLEQYAQQAMKARTAIVKLAALKSEAELAQLAATDRDAYILEDARHRAVNAALAEIDAEMNSVVQQHQAAQQEASAREVSAAWGKLGQHGINKEKLVSIFGDVHKLYGVEQERFAVVRDPRLVLIMKDAVAYRQLQDKAKTMKGKVREAPQLPAARQSTPRNEQVNKQLNKRFQSGKASTRDLASFLLTNKL